MSLSFEMKAINKRNLPKARQPKTDQRPHPGSLASSSKPEGAVVSVSSSLIKTSFTSSTDIQWG